MRRFLIPMRPVRHSLAVRRIVVLVDRVEDRAMVVRNVVPVGLAADRAMVARNVVRADRVEDLDMAALVLVARIVAPVGLVDLAEVRVGRVEDLVGGTVVRAVVPVDRVVRGEVREAPVLAVRNSAESF